MGRDHLIERHDWLATRAKVRPHSAVAIGRSRIPSERRDTGEEKINCGGKIAHLGPKGATVTKLTAREIVQKSLTIACEICIFSNTNITVLEPEK